MRLGISGLAGLALLTAGALMSGCSANYPAAHLTAHALAEQVPAGAFTMADGARLPYREWPAQTSGPAKIVVLALHGFNDSADGWELPGPALAAAGITLIAPDQRGFGAAPDRGRWPGTRVLASDAATMAADLAARFPRAKLYLMGESMGGAVLMRLAGKAPPPNVAGYVLVAPAVWGWSQMNLFLRAALWLTNAVVPGMELSPGPIRVKASDNRAALMRLSEDPRTLLRTRVAAVKGLVDLMDKALKAAPSISAPALVMYGGHDELVPKHATTAAWRALAEDPRIRLAYYPAGYHLLLRDLGRAAPTEDLIAWLRNQSAPLPSGADTAAREFLSHK
jgi:acylglycerol lipase